ncbi:hypothetical protein J6590_044805 [Homalodisca vitripennis]|nr:hypothetical protein J6590_044805 [Homalodisca vitripennis]
MNARLNFLFEVNVTEENIIRTNTYSEWDVILVGDILSRKYPEVKYLLPWIRLARRAEKQVYIGQPKQSLQSLMPNVFEYQLLESYDNLPMSNHDPFAQPSTQVWRLLRTY